MPSFFACGGFLISNVLILTYCFWLVIIGHVNEYLTMHYYRNPRHTQPMIAYNILTFSGNSSEELHSGNVAYIPYCFFVGCFEGGQDYWACIIRFLTCVLMMSYMLRFHFITYPLFYAFNLLLCMQVYTIILCVLHVEAAPLRWLDFSTNQINIRVIFLQQNLSLCSSWRVDLMCG